MPFDFSDFEDCTREMVDVLPSALKQIHQRTVRVNEWMGAIMDAMSEWNNECKWNKNGDVGAGMNNQGP